MYYESVHSVIWGSQLALLRHLNSATGGSSLEVLKVFYDGGAAKTPSIYSEYPFEQYLDYLVGHNLVEKKR